MAASPRFDGGQLIYSLLSEMSGIWKSTDNPSLLEPMHVRNVPFYGIEIVVTPAGLTQAVALTRTVIAAYIYRLLKILVSPNVNQWPGPLRCRLDAGPTQLLLGTLDVNLIPINTLGAVSNSSGSNISSNGSTDITALEIANGTTPTLAGNANPRVDGIDIHQVFTGTKTTDKNVLYLFINILCELFGRKPEERLTDLLAPVSILLIASKTCHSNIGEGMLTAYPPPGSIKPRRHVTRPYIPHADANVSRCRCLGIHT